MNNLKIAVIIDNETKRGKLTTDIIADLRAANNPKIILVVGKTREGKSTLYNHILSNKSNNPPLRPSSPFLANAGENAITREFQYYGPIKCSEIAKLNLFQSLNFPIDNDLFFIDSEGTGNLYNTSDYLHILNFCLEGICDSLLYVARTFDTENLSLLARHLQICKLFNNNKGSLNSSLIISVRDVGIAENPENQNNNEQKEQDRINQNNQKTKDLLTRLGSQYNLTFREGEFKYFAHPFLDQTEFFWNSIKDLTKFLLEKSSNNQENISLDNKINKFNKTMDLIVQYPALLEPNKPLEHIFNSIFEQKLKDIKNRIINSNIGQNVINQYTNLKMVNLNKNVEIQYFLQECFNLYDKFCEEDFPGLSQIISSLYQLFKNSLKDEYTKILNNLLNDKINKFNSWIREKINEIYSHTKTFIENDLNTNIANISNEKLRQIDSGNGLENYVNSYKEKSSQTFDSRTREVFREIYENVLDRQEYSKSKNEIISWTSEASNNKILTKIKNTVIWPRNVNELKAEQKITCLVAGTTYILYDNKKPYNVVAENQNEVIIPGLSGTQYYMHEQSYSSWHEYECYGKSQNKISFKFNPDSKTLTLNPCDTYYRNYKAGGHKSLFVSRSPRTFHENKKFSCSVSAPWKIESFNQSGSINVSIANGKRTINANYGNGSGAITNIKLILD